MPPLADQLASLIRNKGSVPFDRFMEQALYHPEQGFYAAGRTRTGKEGDFLTPVSTGSVLGELLARQAEEFHEAFDRPARVRLVEQGADAGWLTRDVVNKVRQHHPKLAKATEIHLIEPHPQLAEIQKKTLREAEIEAQWHLSWETFPTGDVPCFFFSCELVDSFPVRIFRYRSGSWRERLVGIRGSEFIWEEGEVDPLTLARIQHWHPPEAEGFTLELRPAASSWVESWAKKIIRGLVLTLDYGFPASELFSPRHPAGTLVAMENHKLAADPLTSPGQKDLTAHVNFTELGEAGLRAGWTTYGLVDFERGLTTLAIPRLREAETVAEAWARNFRHLTHPSLFGQSHKILVQGKKLPESFTPSIVAKL